MTTLKNPVENSSMEKNPTDQDFSKQYSAKQHPTNKVFSFLRKNFVVGSNFMSIFSMMMNTVVAQSTSFYL